MNYTKHLKSPFFILLITIGFSISLYSQAKSEELNNIIKLFCLENLKEEVERSKSVIKQDIGDYTCDCFVQKINNNENIESARRICIEETSNKFGL